MTRPVLAEITRGGLVESYHTGALVAVDAEGTVRFALGDVDRPVFPRSAYKPIQTLALVESGAAAAHGLSDSDVALACASHNGEAVHHDRVQAWLAELDLDETALACGVDSPMEPALRTEFDRARRTPNRAYHNCSGKHAGMLTLCRHAGHAYTDYQAFEHPSQRHWRHIMGELCEVDTERCAWDYDGCGLPALAFPLTALARGFARLVTPGCLTGERAAAAERIVTACNAHPHMVAGTGRACTRVMACLDTVTLVKTGAEGVFAGGVPSLGIGFALKIDDGARRGSEVALGAALDALGVLDGPQRDALADVLAPEVRNSRGQRVGGMRVPEGLVSTLRNGGAS
ncbi:MAG: asparaginase [Pseudomonadota bacterium]